MTLRLMPTVGRKQIKWKILGLLHIHECLVSGMRLEKRYVCIRFMVECLRVLIIRLDALDAAPALEEQTQLLQTQQILHDGEQKKLECEVHFRL